MKGEANRSRIEKQAMRTRGSRREGVKKGKRKKRKKKVWSGGVGGSMVMVQEDEEGTSGLTEEEEAFVRSWTTVLSAVFASQLGAVLFGVTYVGGDSGHVPGGEDTIGSDALTDKHAHLLPKNAAHYLSLIVYHLSIIAPSLARVRAAARNKSEDVHRKR